MESQKKDLFDQLNEILIRYQSYKRESVELTKRKVDLEKLKSQNEGQFCAPVTSLQNTFLEQIDKELKTIVMPTRPKLVSFVCDKQKLLTEVNKLCKLVERVNEIDYTSRTQSIISVCDQGTGNEQLDCPYGVTVDPNTGNIYVADTSNSCVKVFDNTAKYLFKFGDGKGEGKMSYPTGFLIRDNTVFVSHNHCILVYQLDGKFVSRIGSKGSGKLQFNWPYGLSTDESNNDIYICDYNNNRIQIISENLQYKSQFGKATLHSPRDVKHYKDNIFILDKSNPCLHIYNRDLVLQKSVVTKGRGQQVIDPYSYSLTSSVIFLSQILTLILFSFLIQNLNSFTKSLLTDQEELQWMKKIELLLCLTLLSVYRYSNTLEIISLSSFYISTELFLSTFLSLCVILIYLLKLSSFDTNITYYS